MIDVQILTAFLFHSLHWVALLITMTLITCLPLQGLPTVNSVYPNWNIYIPALGNFIFCLILQWLCSVIMLAFILNKSTKFIFLTRNRSLVTPQQSYSQLNVEQWSLIPYRKTSSICREIYLLYQHVKERLLNEISELNIRNYCYP